MTVGKTLYYRQVFQKLNKVNKVFLINKIQSAEKFSEDVTDIFKIYEIHENSITVGKEEKSQKVAIKIQTKEIISHLNKTRHMLESSEWKKDFPSHFEPLAITGTTVASFSTILLIVFVIILCRHI